MAMDGLFLSALGTPSHEEEDDDIVYRRGCLRLHSARDSLVGDFQ